MSTRSRKTFCLLLYIYRSVNRPTTQWINHSAAQTSNNKFTHKTNPLVTKSTNKPSLESSTHLITSSPHHRFVRTASRTSAWSLKYKIAISHNNPLRNSHTLQIHSEPNRIVTHAINIPLIHLLICPFVWSPNDSSNQSCHHQVIHSSIHLLIKSICSTSCINN